MSSRRRSRSASSSGSSSSGSRSPKKAMKRISSTPPRKQAHHPDASISPAGKDRRSPSPRARRGRGSASPPRSSGIVFLIISLFSYNYYPFVLVLSTTWHFGLHSSLCGYEMNFTIGNLLTLQILLYVRLKILKAALITATETKSLCYFCTGLNCYILSLKAVQQLWVILMLCLVLQVWSVNKEEGVILHLIMPNPDLLKDPSRVSVRFCLL